MDNDQKNILNSALKFLSYRPRSKKEITDYLTKKTSDETFINQTIEKLDLLKLINDEEFANWLVKSRSRNRGSIFIKQDLKKYGIDPKTISLKSSDFDTAISLLNKKKFDDKNKAYRYLAYRGIPGNVIAQAIKTVYNSDNVS